LNVAGKNVNAKLATAIVSSRPDFSFLTILSLSEDCEKLVLSNKTTIEKCYLNSLGISVFSMQKLRKCD